MITSLSLSSNSSVEFARLANLGSYSQYLTRSFPLRIINYLRLYFHIVLFPKTSSCSWVMCLSPSSLSKVFHPLVLILVLWICNERSSYNLYPMNSSFIWPKLRYWWTFFHGYQNSSSSISEYLWLCNQL